MSSPTTRGARRWVYALTAVAFTAGALATATIRHARAAVAPPLTAPAPEIGPAPAVPSLAPIVRRVAPAVVNISVEGTMRQRAIALPDDPLLRRFFGAPEEPVEQPYQAAGSGVIMDAARGYVLTNNHVVDHADRITVTLSDKRRFEAKVVGRDPEADVAVIRIPARNLTAIAPATSGHLEVGDYVVAIGNPFGLNSTVTAGIVSALGRSGLDIEGYEDFIQTDASINPGNSGGALVNLQGELVGINTAIASPTGGNVGIGFAIPLPMAQAIMTRLIEHGTVVRGQLGVMVQDVTPDIADAMHLGETRGALVSSVVPGSPADQAGVRAGDVIVRLDSADVGGAADLRNRVGLLPVGSTVRLGLLRDGHARTATVRLASRDGPPQAGGELDARLDGVLLSPTAPEADPRGVVVREIEPRSAAALAGLRNGDVITAIDRDPVMSLEDVRRLVHASNGALLLNVSRGGRALFLALR